MTKWGLFQECQGGSVFKSISVTCHINMLKKKICISISIFAEKLFDKSNTMCDINSQKDRNKRYPHLDKHCLQCDIPKTP